MADSYKRVTGLWPNLRDYEHFWTEALTNLDAGPNVSKAVSPIPSPRAQPETEPPEEEVSPCWDRSTSR